MKFLIFILVLIVGLPQFSETVYTPSLPQIAADLSTTPTNVEHTLTIFIFGLAIGTLFWGILSDRIGRKPCVIVGIIIFVLGCVGCYFSTDISTLMISRFISSIGCSVGSVIGQTVARDSFSGPALGKVYSIVGMSLAIFPAIGPVIGGYISENYSWNNIFLVLGIFGMILLIIVFLKLPETGNKTLNEKFRTMAFNVIKDKRVLQYTLIIGCINGITFSYFSEGSFYMIKLLGMTPSNYGESFILMSAAILFGGFLSKRLQDSHGSKKIMDYGITIVLIATSIFSLLAILNYIYIELVIAIQMIIRVGSCMIITNGLALALVNHRNGTAQSIFGLSYYCLISFFTYVMGLLHNGTLLPMPIYFLLLSLIMKVTTKSLKS